MHRLRSLAALLLLTALGLLACRHGSTATAGAPVEKATASSEARWWHGSVFYEVFVRSFADADGDGKGDLRGLTARLDHLVDLGVDAMWLMPIHPSPSYHGYDVTDDRAVNPDYGTLEDFRALLEAAKARGLRVIIDFVMNHASREHPWFQDALRDPESKYRDYFVFREAADPRWKRPWDGASVWHSAPVGVYYGLFWEGMPDWNLGNAEVFEHMVESMRFWLRLGVAGFRVDAARHLFEGADGQLVDRPENHVFMKRVRAALEPEFPELLLVAEAWSDTETVASYYGDGDEFHLAFSFDLAAAVKSSVRDGNRADLNQALARAAKAYRDRRFEAPFLANHDMQRVMRSLEGDLEEAKLATAVLMALPGTPFLYYGEEIGMQGGPSPKDEDKRTPMRWSEEKSGDARLNPNSRGSSRVSPDLTARWHWAEEGRGVSVAAQKGQPGSLYEAYRELVGLRKAEAALMHGEVSTPSLSGGGRGTLAIRRTHEGTSVLFLANLADEAAEVSVSLPWSGKTLWSVGEVELSGGAELTARLGPRSAAFLK